MFSENVSADKKIYFETVCGHKEFHISCDYGRPPTIQVLGAQWGRMKTNICPLMYEPKLGCNSDVFNPVSMR